MAMAENIPVCFDGIFFSSCPDIDLLTDQHASSLERNIQEGGDQGTTIICSVLSIPRNIRLFDMVSSLDPFLRIGMACVSHDLA